MNGDGARKTAPDGATAAVHATAAASGQPVDPGRGRDDGKPDGAGTPSAGTPSSGASSKSASASRNGAADAGSQGVGIPPGGSGTPPGGSGAPGGGSHGNGTPGGQHEAGGDPPVAPGVRNLRRLLEVARGARRPLIHLQHNPDPDALASAEALRYLLHRLLGVDSVLAYTGRVSRAENRAMLRHLQIRIRPSFHVRYADHDLLLVVDTHPGSGTCKIPGDRVPDVVVDHHPSRGDLSNVRFLYFDPHFGSTSTMVGALLVENGIPFDARLATALTYGIRTDTMDLARSAGEHDERIYREVYGRADKQVLARIVGARVPQEYFVQLERALRRGEVTDFAVTTWLGAIDHGDVVAEIADLLLRMEGIRWVMVAGHTPERLVASLRAFRATDPAAGDVAHEISDGHGGGHDTFAAMQRPLRRDEDPWAAYGELRDRFLVAVRAKKTLTRPLTLPPDVVTREVPPPSPSSKGRRRRKTEAPRVEPDEAV
ncbi:MAG: bifunctional oligoribonuclease/PAP phosphatase NrnA [Planctomycetota bacterium]